MAAPDQAGDEEMNSVVINLALSAGWLIYRALGGNSPSHSYLFIGNLLVA